jgi:hypothetical protein
MVEDSDLIDEIEREIDRDIDSMWIDIGGEG